jgi:sortase A
MGPQHSLDVRATPGSGPARDRRRALRWARRFCLVAGFGLLGFAGIAWLDGRAASRDGVARFEAAQAAATAAISPAGQLELPRDGPDQSLWGEGRRAAYRGSLAEDPGVPLGVLRIPRLDLEVAVWEGTGDLALNRGLGRISGELGPERGNLALAGHRDGFFRVLKEIRLGDAIELETRAGVERLAVEATWVVAPADVWVLAPTPARAVTLVTCYPFYFVGKAPQRFIVRAVPGASAAASSDGEAPRSS